MRARRRVIGTRFPGAHRRRNRHRYGRLQIGVIAGRLLIEKRHHVRFEDATVLAAALDLAGVDIQFLDQAAHRRGQHRSMSSSALSAAPAGRALLPACAIFSGEVGSVAGPLAVAPASTIASS